MTDTGFADISPARSNRWTKRRSGNRPDVMFRLSLTDLLVMAFFWVLLYAEPISLGPLKLSELWKAGTVLFLSMILIRRHMPVWFLFAILFAVKCLIYTTAPYGIIDNISVLMEFFFMPVLMLYFLRTMSRHQDWADRLVILSLKLAVFFIFATLPFLLGLQSLYPVRDLSMWGSDARAITGFFASLSPASKIFYTAALILVAGHAWFPRNVRYQCLYWIGLLLGSYYVYGSFTRTGWLIYAGGIVLIVLFQRGATRKMIALTFFGMAALVLGIYLLQNQAFLLRLAGGAAGYREDVEIGIDALLRARLPFIFTAIDNLNHHGAPGWLLGHGVKSGTDFFKSQTGMAITPHNGLFNMLAATGLIGVGFFVIFCGVLGRVLIRAYRVDPMGRIFYLITAYIWLATFAISHGLPFYAQAMLIGPLVRALLVNRMRGDIR